MKWFADTVPKAVLVEFDRYIQAGDLAQTMQRLERIQAESDESGGFVRHVPIDPTSADDVVLRANSMSDLACSSKLRLTAIVLCALAAGRQGGGRKDRTPPRMIAPPTVIPTPSSSKTAAGAGFKIRGR